MNLSELSINRPVFAWMLMAALIMFGAISFHRLGVSQLPDVDFPVVSVSLSLPGAAPEIMESQVVDPIEDAVMGIQGIRNVNSSSSQSSGSVSIEFELDRNIDEAVQEVQMRIGQVQSLLPKGLVPPTVRKSNPEDQPIIWIAISADPKIARQDLMSYARNDLYNQFGTVEGVGDIALGGYVDPALRVWVDIDRLNRLNLTADDVVNAITTEHVEVPAGRIENATHEYNVRIMGEAKTPEDFSKILIKQRSGSVNYRPFQLSQIGKVEEGLTDVRRIARSNSRFAVGLGILKQHGSNAVDVANNIKAKLKEIQASAPKEYTFSIRSDTTKFIKQSIDELNFILLLSALCTALVCFFFLGSWTSTLNVLLAIPTSIIGTFMAIYFFGFTLNTFTLLGLSLAIGIVVDDAIMMLENIVRHRELGEKKRRAAILGSKEITFAALAATIAVVAIFLPVVFMKGVIGRYFYQYGVTVSAAVLLSLLEALTLTPMRCSQYLRVNTDPNAFAGKIDKVFHKLAGTYQRFLAFLLRWRWATLGIATILFVASFMTSNLIKSELMPAQDQSMVLLRLKTKVGSSLPFTDSKFKEVEAYLSKIPEIEGYFSTVGGFGGDAVNQGMIFVTMVDPSKRKISQGDFIQKIRADMKEQIKGIQVFAQDLSLRGFAASRGFPVEIIVQGPDWNELTKQTKVMMEEMTKSGLMTDVNTDVQDGMPEIQLTPDRKAMSERGVSLATVTSAMNSLVGGAILNGQTEYAKKGHRYSIEVRLRADQRNQTEQLDKIFVRNNRGETVPLSKLVKREEHPSLMLISRLNRFRAITVYANVAAGHAQQDALAATLAISKKVLPPGYEAKLTGSSQSFKESFQSLLYAMLLGFVVSYMVLASQFNSFLHPVLVLLALPFSFSGAFIGLLVSHQTLNLYSIIGIILLMGIAKKNSILLVDFTNHLRRQGRGVNEALLEACPVRLRPILMTSLATIAGAIPEAIALGPGAEVRIPMAMAIIGGVFFSTILTLFVIPCAYSLASRLERPVTAD